MNISGRAVVKALMRPFVIVQVEVITQASEQSRHGGILFDVDVLYLTVRQSRSTKMLSKTRPRMYKVARTSLSDG